MSEFLETGLEVMSSRAYVGSYTSEGLNGHSEGINVFQINPVSGDWKHQQLLKGVVDPSFLVLDRQGKLLYCANESQAAVSAFSIELESGQLSELNRQSTQGDAPASLALDPASRFLIAGNYSGGSVAVFPIEPDGKLGAISQLVKLTGKPGPDPVEQTASHPHAICFDPTGNYVFVPDKGFDRVFIFKFEAESGKLTPNEPPFVEVPAGAGPRHIAFHPGGHYAFLINELNSTISAFSYDSQQGTLAPLQTVSSLPPDFRGKNTAAEIAVAPSGKFVYGSNRGHDSIMVFAFNESHGQLSPVEWVAAGGETPRFFSFDPTGKILYVANQNSENIVAFRVDETSGRLTPTGHNIVTESPVCIAFKPPTGAGE